MRGNCQLVQACLIALAQDQRLPFHRNTGSLRLFQLLRHSRKRILFACRLVLVARTVHTVSRPMTHVRLSVSQCTNARMLTPNESHCVQRWEFRLHFRVAQSVVLGFRMLIQDN